MKRTFTEHSFRLPPTLGCIDPPEKEGRLVQALLVRKLLWERMTSGQIATVMAGRGTGDGRDVEPCAGDARCGGAYTAGYYGAEKPGN